MPIHTRELNLSGEYGQVIVTDTKGPFELRTLFYEIYCVKKNKSLL